MGDMTRLLLLLLWVGVAVSTPVDVQKRIIGGTKCGDERQYHVKVEGNNSTHVFLCGGSLISDSWILTAAHCKQKNITAYLGVHPNGPGTPEVITEQPVIYENNSYKHDIMLLKLPKPTQIKPVNLPDCKAEKIPALGATVETAGLTNETLGPNRERVRGETDTLLCVKLGIVAESYQSCRDASDYGNTHYKLFQSVWNRDISKGDSGGGVVYNGMIYGVQTFTLDKDHGCVAAAGFADVCKYQTWIESTAHVTFPK